MPARPRPPATAIAALLAPAFLPKVLGALGHPGTYDLRRSSALRFGLLMALPLLLVTLACSAPTWACALAGASVLLAGVLLSAAGCVVLTERVEAVRVTTEAAAASVAHGAESAVLRGEAGVERDERQRLQALQLLAREELTLAQRVNSSLLPDDLLHPDVEVVARQIPCAYIGGDYLHADLSGPDLLYLCVGDVSGHGVSAALVVNRLHGLVQRLVFEQCEPARFLEALDRAAARVLTHTAFFLTFAVFRVDLAAGQMDYATAGHPPPLLLRRGGEVERLGTGNGLMGTRLPGVLGPPRPGRVRIGAGDALVLFTDGLFEVAAREADALLGEEGLLALLAPLRRLPPADLAEALLDGVAAFGRPGPFADDVSLMVARFGARKPPPTSDARVEVAEEATPV